MKFKSVDVAATGNAVGAGAAGAPLLRRRGVGARAGRAAARRRSSGHARRCSWRDAPVRTGRRWRWRRRRREPGTIAASRRCSRSSIRSRRRCRRRCSGRVRLRRAEALRLAGVRRGPPRKPRRRPRAPRGRAVRELALTDRGRARARGRRPLRGGRDPRGGVALGDRAPNRSRPASAPSTSRSRRATRARPACASSRRRRGQDADPRRAVHVRARLAERAALGAVRERRDHRRAAAGRLDRGLGAAARRRRRAGRSRR